MCENIRKSGLLSLVVIVKLGEGTWIHLLTWGRSLESSLAPCFVRDVSILSSLTSPASVQNRTCTGFCACKSTFVQHSFVKILITSTILQAFTRSFTYIVSLVINNKHSSETSIIRRLDILSYSGPFIFCVLWDCFSGLLLCQGCNSVQCQVCY